MVLLIIAACSGTGKSTLARCLLDTHPELRLSVSYTTRSPRPEEVDGVHYHFVERGAFERRIADGKFAEWAEYAGNFYGTAHSTIAIARDRGHDLVFDVDVVGARSLKSAYPDAVSVFILPPSWSELERRLRARGTEDEATIERRFAAARSELEAAPSFDYLVVNDVLDAASADLDHVYRAAGLRTAERLELLDELN